ncbi:MAG: hypothetical protein PF482_15615 [Desulfobacteraceae bacterium]|jgi:hypothetical protein|nr:hypothetical protein [Desulfobacteraceae bacterium]
MLNSLDGQNCVNDQTQTVAERLEDLLYTIENQFAPALETCKEAISRIDDGEAAAFLMKAIVDQLGNECNAVQQFLNNNN